MSVAFGGEISGIRRLILHEKAHFLHFYSIDQTKYDWEELGGWYKDQVSLVDGQHGIQPNLFLLMDME